VRESSCPAVLNTNIMNHTLR